MPTGIYKHGPRAPRFPVACEVCGTERLYTAKQIAKRNIRFCSYKCSGAALSIPESKVPRSCFQCGKAVIKDRHRVTERSFCSRSCVSASRKRTDAKWRDPAYIAEYMKNYATAHSAQRRVHEKRSRDKNHGKRMAAQRERRKVTPADRNLIGELLRRGGGLCVYCGQPGRIEVDHLHPVARGGKSNRKNLVPCCRSCNASKGIRAAEDWIYEKHGVEGLARTLLFIQKRDKTAKLARLYPGSEILITGKAAKSEWLPRKVQNRSAA